MIFIGLLGSVVICVLWVAILFNYEKSNKRYTQLQKEKSIWEDCSSCGEMVYVLKTEPIEKRLFYIEGVGQLCEKCYDYIHQHRNSLFNNK
jgi:formylmethanofuran dehydrogenase subunit E